MQAVRGYRHAKVKSNTNVNNSRSPAVYDAVFVAKRNDFNIYLVLSFALIGTVFISFWPAKMFVTGMMVV